MIRAGIVGGTGYGGVELIRLLSAHPHAVIHRLYTSSAEGEHMAKVFGHLAALPLPALAPIDPERMAAENDAVFLATPSGVSAELTPKLLAANPELKVIDLSGDFRLQSTDEYRQWYNKEPAPQEWLEQAVYGLCEWNGDAVASARLIANPGCYPTATLLALLPLAKTGWVDPQSWIVDAKSGVSGAGRGVSLGVHYSEVNENLGAYKVGVHQHTPEIEQELRLQSGQVNQVQFTPHLVPMTRGILVTAYGRLQQDVTWAQLDELYRTAYEGKPFVRIREKGAHPRTKEVYGSNYCDIAIHLDERTGRVILLSVIDNMGKGAAGQAVQNLNLLFGFDETAGLPMVPVYP